MAQIRNTESFKRRGPRFQTQKIVLVVCEDAKSSKLIWRRHHDIFELTLKLNLYIPEKQTLLA